jgi:GNAT superfamily N-acetyltransferase
MIFRLATEKDIETIALLHAQSWQKHYRGIFLDEYLDNEVVNDRVNVWQNRLTQPSDNQRVILAEENQTALGFVCVFGEEDAEWGALVDNLHARAQRRGVGKTLLSLAAKWVKETYPDSKLHLWVLEKNYPARAFYDKMGGQVVEQSEEENPGGGFAQILRYAWSDLDKLSQNIISERISVSY